LVFFHSYVYFYFYRVEVYINIKIKIEILSKIMGVLSPKLDLDIISSDVAADGGGVFESRQHPDSD